MSRTRAERRHNTQVKCSTRQEFRDHPDVWMPCSFTVTPGGERKTCMRCMRDKRNWRWDFPKLGALRAIACSSMDDIDIADFT